jgi:cytochrome c-type biogenesis protein CcmE
VRDALATLPWVEQGTIQVDPDTKQVRFGINDKAQFSEEALRQALPSRYRKGLAVVSGPTPT